MSQEIFDKVADVSEKFVLKVLADRIKHTCEFFSQRKFSLRRATAIEDRDYKCDIFLMKNGEEYIAFDVKAPIGVSGKTIFEADSFWFSPYVENVKKPGEQIEKDISTVIKSKIPTIVNRYIAFIGTEAIYCVKAERLGVWAIGNRRPDFHLWLDKKSGRAAFVEFNGKDSLTNFFIKKTKDQPDKILTKIQAKELEKISHKITFTPAEKEEWSEILKSLAS